MTCIFSSQCTQCIHINVLLSIKLPLDFGLVFDNIISTPVTHWFCMTFATSPHDWLFCILWGNGMLFYHLCVCLYICYLIPHVWVFWDNWAIPRTTEREQNLFLSRDLIDISQVITSWTLVPCINLHAKNIDLYNVHWSPNRIIRKPGLHRNVTAPTLRIYMYIHCIIYSIPEQLRFQLLWW